MKNVEFISMDQNYQNEETVYWFSVELHDESQMTFGVSESCGEAKIIDEDGCPIEGHWYESEVSSLVDYVTDEIREMY